MKSIIRESGLSNCRKHSIDHGKLEERGKYTIEPHRIWAYFLKKKCKDKPEFCFWRGNHLSIDQSRISIVFGEVTI